MTPFTNNTMTESELYYQGKQINRNTEDLLARLKKKHEEYRFVSLGAEIGRGATGSVRKLSDTQVEKVFTGETDEAKQYIPLEKRVCERLKSKKFMFLPEIFEVSDHRVVMSFQGFSLQCLLEHRPINQWLLSIILWSVCIAIKELNLIGFIHRDIHPRNILLKLVDNQINVRLCDYGSCSDNIGVTRFQYLNSAVAPESKYDFKSDIYTLGYRIWEILLLAISPAMESSLVEEHMIKLYGGYARLLLRMKEKGDNRPGVEGILSFITKKLIEGRNVDMAKFLNNDVILTLKLCGVDLS